MTTDVVCILDEDLTQVAELARPIKAVVKEEAQVMAHPLETGAQTTDHMVIQPTVIELSLVLASEDFAAVYQAIRERFYRGELLTVQTRTGSYPNMIISAMPHEESADMADGTTLACTLTEAQFVEPQFSDLKVRSANDSKTVKRGEQQPKETPPERRGSVLSGIFQ